MGCLKLTYRNEESSPLKASWKGNGAENPCTGVENYKYNGKEEQKETEWYDYGARMYDAWLGRWNHIDAAGEEYFSTSPYVYALNTPLNAIDPDGKRVFFVAGAGNDEIGWNYVEKWHKAFDARNGIQGFTRINASHGTKGDIAFTANYRDNGYSNSYEGRHGILQLRSDLQIDKAVNDIKDDLSNNPLAVGEQLNLAGYSYGSVLQAHAALKLANGGTYIDNLILVGSPISSKSKLFNQLQKNENIGKVIRIDIENDLLSDPNDIYEFIKGGVSQNRDPNNTGEGPHFDLARPGEGEGDNNDTYKRIRQAVVDYLKKRGVK